ncbi:LSU ribosomal protein L25P [Syntrophus gentianae]|uniref:Large ribosomal subunit protein bL25 n=1 Tax=Syntrophus gentianae TaxID=43775 RepID=A0A1H7YIR2_9BACT|nr:50S ribosomal protein L25/general stress protein Ctc [Syntrophus gentianae]SEM45724.1 LSU ribosomal protein L25P [Syntrophus gentianae]
MEARELKATLRENSGKGSAKRLRRKGLIPAVLYGPGTETLSLSVDASDLKTIRKGHEDNMFIKLLIDEAGKQVEKNSLIKEIQTEPLTGDVFHADFYAVRSDHKVTLEVPIHFTGQPVGIEKGGELQHLRREIKVSCLPAALPEFIPLDISGLDVGDSILIRDMHLPENISCVDSEDIAVVTVSALHAAKKEEAAEGAGEPAE